MPNEPIKSKLHLVGSDFFKETIQTKLHTIFIFGSDAFFLKPDAKQILNTLRVGIAECVALG